MKIILLFINFAQNKLIMAKIDSVNKYRDEFLAGKTPAQIEKFNNKDVDRQYASIMTWRHKQRLNDAKSTSAADIIEHLRLTRTKISSLPLMTCDDADRIEAELESLSGFLTEWRTRRKEEEIRELENQQLEIARKLKALKGDTPETPSLFGND